MIEDLFLWLKTPLGEEIFLSFLLPFIASVLILWGISHLFNLKKKNFLTALWVGYLYVILNFLIRLINILFNLSVAQKPPINMIAGIISNILLIILLVVVYKASWWKTILSWLIVYFGKFMLIGIVMIAMMLFIPAFSESDSGPVAKVGIADFTINEIGSEIGTNQFIAYRSNVVTPISIRAINLDSSVAFDSKTSGITMDLECNSEKGRFIDAMEDKTDEYEFHSIPQDDLNLTIVGGFAHFDCDEICPKERI